jgi:hypothetical protein
VTAAAANADTDDQWLADLGPGFGVVGGAEQGGAAGDVKAGASGAQLASNSGVISGAQPLATGLGGVADVLGVVQGVEAGGESGYTEAASDALKTYAAGSSLDVAAGGAGFAGAGAAAGLGTFGVADLAMQAGVYELGRIGGSGMDMNSFKWNNMSPTQQAQAYNPDVNNPFSQKGAAYTAAASKPPPGKYFAGVGKNGLPTWGDTPMQWQGTWQNGALEPGSNAPAPAPKPAPDTPAAAAAAKAPATPPTVQPAGQISTLVPKPAVKAPTAKSGIEAVQQTLEPAVQTFGTSSAPGPNIAAVLAPAAVFGAAGTAGAAMADPSNPGATTSTGTAVQADPGSNPGVNFSELGSTDASGSSDTSLLSSLGGDLSSFLSSPLGSVAEFGTLAGLGLSEANSQKKETDTLAGEIAAPGAPYTAAGAAELGQLEGGKQMGGPMGSSIAQQTQAASELGQVATEYGSGNLTSAQTTQVNQYVSQQRAQVNAELAAAGITDTNSSEYQTAYAQIDNNAAVLTQQLQQGNVTMASGALNQVQTTYSNLLNQALSSSAFGLGATESAITLEVQQDNQTTQQLQQLFGAIAQGFGASYGGSKSGTSSGGTPGVSTGSGGGSGGGTSVGSVPGSTQTDSYNQVDASSGTVAQYDALDTSTGAQSDIVGSNIGSNTNLDISQSVAQQNEDLQFEQEMQEQSDPFESNLGASSTIGADDPFY